MNLSIFTSSQSGNVFKARRKSVLKLKIDDLGLRIGKNNLERI